MKLTDADKTLLSFFLALKDSQESLNEQSVLALASERLAANPEAWKPLIEPPLLELIRANQSLNESFQFYKSQLDELDELSDRLLPISIMDELERVAPTGEIQPTVRAALKLDLTDLRSEELTNMAIRVMATPDPATTVKKLNALERIKQFLHSKHF